jgi:hypothetical protein
MQYRNCIRKLAHFLLAFGLFSANAAPVFAQTIPLCETNVGVPGQLLDGYHGMVYSPVAFEHVRTEGAQFEAYSDLQDGLGVLVSAGSLVSASQDERTVANENRASDEGLIQFLQSNGTIAHQCRVVIVAYDPSLHDMATLQVGDCDLTQLAGLPQLVVDHAQVLAFAHEFEEISIAPVRIADTSTLSASSIYLVAKSVGVVVIAAIRGNFGEERSIRLCPFTAISPQEAFGDRGLNDEQICKDVNNMPMRLAVGQTAILVMPQGAEHPVSFTDFAISAPDVLETLGYEKMGNSWTIKAVAPGTSSLTAVTSDGLQAMGCEVVVQ